MIGNGPKSGNHAAITKFAIAASFVWADSYQLTERTGALETATNRRGPSMVRLRTLVS
jgi:hypothetical protein